MCVYLIVSFICLYCSVPSYLLAGPLAHSLLSLVPDVNLEHSEPSSEGILVDILCTRGGTEVIRICVFLCFVIDKCTDVILWNRTPLFVLI